MAMNTDKIILRLMESVPEAVKVILGASSQAHCDEYFLHIDGQMDSHPV